MNNDRNNYRSVNDSEVLVEATAGLRSLPQTIHLATDCSL